MLLPLTIAGREPDREWVDQLIDVVKLGDRRTHRPAELSGGQQQRVAVARALVSKPAVVFADEPTGNLDSTASDEIMALLRRSVDEFGQTVVMVTHDEHAASFADRLVVLARRPHQRGPGALADVPAGAAQPGLAQAEDVHHRPGRVPRGRLRGGDLRPHRHDQQVLRRHLLGGGRGHRRGRQPAGAGTPGGSRAARVPRGGAGRGARGGGRPEGRGRHLLPGQAGGRQGRAAGGGLRAELRHLGAARAVRDPDLHEGPSAAHGPRGGGGRLQRGARRAADRRPGGRGGRPGDRALPDRRAWSAWARPPAAAPAPRC